jgi:hypothetical protein
MDLSDRLQKLGEAVASENDRLADRAALDRARRAFVSGAPAPRPSVWRARFVPALAAALCVALAIFAWRSRTAPAAHPVAISFTAGGAPGVVGEWVAAGAAAPLDVRFSEGSSLALSPEARMRVTTTRPEGADVLIERGSVRASVAHPNGRAARWAVRAGPFEVRVTGTSFDAAWDPISETFELTMIDGVVAVSGPLIPPDRRVVAGERLVVSVREARMMLTANVPTTTAPSAAPAVTSATPIEPAPTSAPAPAHSASAAQVAAPAPEWRSLASSGKYKDALAIVESAGFDQEIARAGSAGDLLLLADIARFAGSAPRAREALLAARKRFGARGRSAFLLGKIAADQQGSPGEAVVWFETYLREEPGGALAEQALGRIVDLSRRSSPEAARQAAQRYLARYPEGSYAALARSLSGP